MMTGLAIPRLRDPRLDPVPATFASLRSWRTDQHEEVTPMKWLSPRAFRKNRRPATSRNRRPLLEVLEDRVVMSVSPVGPEFRVNTTTANDQRYPTVAMDADGDFVVSWTGWDGGG